MKLSEIQDINEVVDELNEVLVEKEGGDKIGDKLDETSQENSFESDNADDHFEASSEQPLEILDSEYEKYDKEKIEWATRIRNEIYFTF